MTNSQQQPKKSSWLWSRTGLVLLAFSAIAAFFLITEHTAHLFGILPFLLLFLCPLLHLFHHRGHGAGHDKNGHRHDEQHKGGV